MTAKQGERIRKQLVVTRNAASGLFVLVPGRIRMNPVFHQSAWLRQTSSPDLGKPSTLNLAMPALSKLSPDVGADWLIEGPLLPLFLDLALLRRAHDRRDGCGLEVPWAQRLGKTTPSFTVHFRDERLLQRFDGLPELRLTDLVKKCRLNNEATDPTTLCHKEIMSHSTDRNRSMWAYFLGQFSGRQLAERIVAHGGRLQGNSVQEIISWAVYLVDDPSDMFSPHFLPQAERHHAFRGYDRDSFLDTLRQDRKLSLNPRKICFRKPDSSF